MTDTLRLSDRLAAVTAERDEARHLHSVWLTGALDRDRTISGLQAERDDLARQVEAVTALAYASDDGTEYEHNGHQTWEGEPECPGCWAQSIRAALAPSTPPATDLREDADHDDPQPTADRRGAQGSRPAELRPTSPARRRVGATNGSSGGRREDPSGAEAADLQAAPGVELRPGPQHLGSRPGVATPPATEPTP